MRIDGKSQVAKQYIGSIMDDMEKIKSNSNFKKVEKEEHKAEIETLALRIFAIADEVDKKGEATKRTAQTFSTAYVLCEVLKQFGERDVEIVTKGKYALLKTGSILKALKEGKQPEVGIPKELKAKISSESDLPGPTSLNLGGGVVENGGQMDVDVGNDEGVYLGHTAIESNMSVDTPTAEGNKAEDCRLDFNFQKPVSVLDEPDASLAVQIQHKVDEQKLVDVCCGVEETTAVAMSYMASGDANAAVGVMQQFITNLTPFNQGGNWQPPIIQQRDKNGVCLATKEKMRHMVSALRFLDVHAALMILRQCVQALSPFCVQPSASNYI